MPTVTLVPYKTETVGSWTPTEKEIWEILAASSNKETPTVKGANKVETTSEQAMGKEGAHYKLPVGAKLTKVTLFGYAKPGTTGSEVLSIITHAEHVLYWAKQTGTTKFVEESVALTSGAAFGYLETQLEKGALLEVGISQASIATGCSFSRLWMTVEFEELKVVIPPPLHAFQAVQRSAVI